MTGIVTNTVHLWSGSFGNDYHRRNDEAAVNWMARVPFWESAVQFCTPATIFELGCGPGWNLRAISTCAPNLDLFGADVNLQAVNDARSAGFEVQHVGEQGIAGLYEPGSMDLVCTAGCLIHVPPKDLERVMRQLVDLSGRYIIACEYHEEDGEVEVEYRGQKGAMWRRNYGRLYEAMGLSLLSVGEAWDKDLTYYLLERGE